MTTFQCQNTELGELPRDWRTISLSEGLILMKNGLTKKQSKNGKGFPVTRIETISKGVINTDKLGYVENLSDEEISTYKLLKNDILVSHINSEPYLGNAAIYTGEPELLIHGMNLLLFRAKDILNPKFLYYICKYYRREGVFIKLSSRAVNQSSINQGKMKAQLIPLPPFSEQQNIECVLSTVQKAQQSTEKVIKSLNEFKRSLMKHLFTYGFISFKDSEIGQIPQGWQIKKFNNLLSENIIEDIQDGNHGEKHPLKKDFVKNHIPFITANCIRNGQIIINYNQTLTEEFIKTLRIGFAKAGDVLLTHKGTLGEVAIVPQELKLLILSPQVTYYRVNTQQKILSKEYLKYFFQTDKFIRELKSLGSAQSTRAYVGITKQKNMTILIPTITEQQQIASILSNVDAKISVEEKKLQSLNELFNSLLKNLMTAKVKVNNLVVSK